MNEKGINKSIHNVHIHPTKEEKGNGTTRSELSNATSTSFGQRMSSIRKRFEFELICVNPIF